MSDATTLEQLHAWLSGFGIKPWWVGDTRGKETPNPKAWRKDAR